MIRINDYGIIYIPVGYSLWVIDKFLGEGEMVTYSFFKDLCNSKSREIGIIEETEGIDDTIVQYAFDEGINRLKHLLNINKRNVLKEVNVKSDSSVQTYYIYTEKYRLFPENKFCYKDCYKIPPCKIKVSDCVIFIDRLLSSNKKYSTYALYSELEKEYCWVESFVRNEDIEKNTAALYRICYSDVLKQSLKRIEEYLIAKDMGELFIRTRCSEYKKQYDCQYAVAGMSVLDSEGKLHKLTRYDKFKIKLNTLINSEINSVNKKKEKKEKKGYSRNSKVKSIADRDISISDIEFITDTVKSITSNIKEKQITSYLKDKLHTIYEICTFKMDGWRENYFSLMNEVQHELKLQNNKFKPLYYADLLAYYTKLLGTYGYSSDTDQVVKDKWYDTICCYYNEMISIAQMHGSRERHARSLIMFANFLRKEYQYKKLEEKYLEAIHIYKQIMAEKVSIIINRDYAYALRSLSKFYSDYDRLGDAIRALTESLSYIEEYECITDSLMQLSMRYAECGDGEKVEEALNKALGYYLKMAKYDNNYYANIANVYIKLLRNISPTNIIDCLKRGRKPKYEEQCEYYISLYKELRGKNRNKHDKIYAHALTSLALYYYDTGQDAAVKKCQEALEFHESIRNNKEFYDINIINHHFYLGRALALPTIQNDDDHLYDSKTEILYAFDFYSRLYKAMVNRGLYVPSIKKGLADTNLALAETYDYLGNRNEARVRYETAIKLYTDLSQNTEVRDKYKESLKKAKELLRLLD